MTRTTLGPGQATIQAESIAPAGEGDSQRSFQPTETQIDGVVGLSDPPLPSAAFGEGSKPARLSEAFGAHADLIVIHNMGRGCAYCTLWADGFIGLHPHLQIHSAFMVVSPDPPDVRRGGSTSRRKDDGSIVRVDHGFFGPGDP